MKKYILIFLIFTSFINLYSQEDYIPIYHLNGIVKDVESKKPIEGVEISVIDSLSNKLIFTTTTDREGLFKVSKKDNLEVLLQNRKYFIKASKEGYLSVNAYEDTYVEYSMNFFHEYELQKLSNP